MNVLDLFSGIGGFSLDVRELGALPAIDLACGGFPCQPFSTASRGRRVARDAWPDMLRIVRINRPRYVIAENVQEAAIALAAGDLSRLGYATYYRRKSGADCGADHQRDRWWAFAYPDTQSELRGAIDAEVAKLPTICRGLWGAKNYARAVRISDGISYRVDERAAVEALGNAIMPPIAEAIGLAIIASDEAISMTQRAAE